MEISHSEAIISIKRLANNNHKVTVTPLKKDFFVPVSSFETKYTTGLIDKILRIKGFDYLCDELAREEDPGYVQRDLEVDLRAYFPGETFAGKRILDFGCGSGASSMILSRMYPGAAIVGVELEESLLSIAEARLEFYKYKNVEFHASPSGSELPPDIGEFDLVIMSAVYEHLLPRERKSVMPMVWERVKTGGSLFMNMTPHRYFPIEHHTTGLPLINYLPDRIVYFLSGKLSRRIDPNESWEILLRRGIRGGTEGEISGLLANNTLIDPSTPDVKDRIDLWYSQLNRERFSTAKGLIKFLMKTLKALTGIVLVPNISLVFRKKGR